MRISHFFPLLFLFFREKKGGSRKQCSISVTHGHCSLSHTKSVSVDSAMPTWSQAVQDPAILRRHLLRELRNGCDPSEMVRLWRGYRCLAGKSPSWDVPACWWLSTFGPCAKANGWKSRIACNQWVWGHWGCCHSHWDLEDGLHLLNYRCPSSFLTSSCL